MCTDGWCLVVNIYIIMLVIMENCCFMFSGKKNWKWDNKSYQYYYTNDECKLINNIEIN